MPGLTLYKASAGSGKTYALARDYISLIIQDPEIFRHILAVTFTNKATDEMKRRILEELYRLAAGVESSIWTGIRDTSGLENGEISARASIILETILHNYSRFHIETIDRFFQRVIRAFTREIGLAAGYQVELDAPRVLSEAVDRMLDGLDRDPDLQQWFVAFARDKVLEGKHWNLRNDLLALGTELNNERFQEYSHGLAEQLADRQGIRKFREELHAIRTGFEKRLQELAGQAVGMIREEELEASDFKGSHGVGYFFGRLLQGDYKYPSNTILNSVDAPDTWVRKGSAATDRIMGAYERGLNELLKQTVQHFEKDYRRYRTAETVRNFLYALGILTDISSEMEEYTRSQGLFLLSDSARFLNGIIGENEAPFIYEKVGNYFHHFMIDEFQDTSGLQWRNFKPLIDNSLANSHECLIVGDVKQSIYRWRNSDWEILSEAVPAAFHPDQLESKELKHNWRSRRNIVAFNNAFFTRAREVVKEFFGEEGKTVEDYSGKIGRAYGDVIQLVPDQPGKEGGYVKAALMAREGGVDWKALVHEQVIGHVEQLQAKGYALSDMAILVRTKKEGKEISDAILSYKSKHSGNGYRYDLISNETLFLVAASSIRILTAVMKYLIRPEDRINLAQLVHEYRTFHEEPVDDSSFAEAGIQHLPAAFREHMGTLRYLTLTELVERITRMFSLHKQVAETPYLLAFQDVVLDYSKHNPADINSFLTWWDDHGEELSLSVSEDQDAIRVMTIHKAKGLQFPIVILPYCHWSLDHRGGPSQILWCGTDQPPFKRIKLLPVKYSSALKDTFFEKDYHKERFRVYVDHLNLMYVAFTRAMEGLFIFAPFPAREKLTDAADLLHRTLGSRKDLTWTSGDFDALGISGERKERKLLQLDRLVSHEFSGKLRLQYRGIHFFDTAAEQRIHQGNLMHEIFSRILTVADVDRAVEAVRREGMIGAVEAGQMKGKISRLIAGSPVSHWFEEGWRVITEQDVLSPEGILKRPDRVMLKDGRAIVVDYKFGRRRSRSHLAQVGKYMNIMRGMNIGEVKGYVWYVNLEEVVAV